MNKTEEQRANFERKFNIIRQKFIDSLAKQSEDLNDFINTQFDKNLSTEEVIELLIKVHNIAGSSRTFGFGELGAQARKCEGILRDYRDTELPLEMITPLKSELKLLASIAHKTA